jgi:DME family drug/metabolite transporter
VALTPQRSGSWLVLGAAALWGTTGTAQALGPDSAEPLAIGIVRLVIGSLGLVAAAAATRTMVHPRRLSPIPLLVAGGAMAAYQPLFFGGVSRTGVAVGTIVAIGSAPILAGLLARAIRGEHLDRRWMLATSAAVAGTALLFVGGEEIGVDAGGVLFALGAGLAYAVYAVTAKALVTDASPIGVMAAVFVIAALMLLPLAPLTSFEWLGEPGGIAVALWLGLAATSLAYTLFGLGLRLVPVSTAATLSLGEPVTAAVLGVTVVGEDLAAGAVAGALLVLVGLALLAMRPASEQRSGRRRPPDRGGAPDRLP